MPDPKPRGLATPLSQRGIPAWLVYPLSLLGVLYMFNPGLGVFEFIPDNLPFVGNLDEGAAVLIIWYGLLEFAEGRRKRKALREQADTPEATLKP